jgi:hypothetical protein
VLVSFLTTPFTARHSAGFTFSDRRQLSTTEDVQYSVLDLTTSNFKLAAMPDFGRNFIDLFGNNAIDALTKEVNKRLDEHDPTIAIGRIFYGLPKDVAIVGKQVTGTDWVRPAQGEFGDENQICLVSSDTIPEKLENHLVWFYSKIDPDVVLRNKYDSDRGDFVGVRFKVVRDGKIFTFHKHRSITASVTFEINPDDDDDDGDKITWDEFWDIQNELAQEALSELIAQFPFARKFEG